MEIIAENLGVSIKGKIIIDGISCRINSGHMTAIIGPSGSGKTTLLNCLSLLQKADTGSVMIDGKECMIWNEAKRVEFWRQHVSFIYQDYGIIEDETILYNITLKKSKSNLHEIRNILERVGLAGCERELGIVLSGGEKQRVAIARAIYKKAEMIVADEPTASLDLANKQIVAGLLKEVAQSGGIVLIATHDEWLINKCDDIINISEMISKR